MHNPVVGVGGWAVYSKRMNARTHEYIRYIYTVYSHVKQGLTVEDHGSSEQKTRQFYCLEIKQNALGLDSVEYNYYWW